MAWTTPADWNFKESPGASKMNTQIRDNLAYLKAALPPGVIMDYAGNTAPTQWLMCDGSAVSRTEYASLFSAIGTTFGAGNGTTTFNLPNKKGRMSIGAGAGTGLTSRILGAIGGEEVKNISHTHTGTTDASTGNYRRGTGDPLLIGNHNHSFTTNSGGSATQDVMNPFIVFNSIIKY